MYIYLFCGIIAQYSLKVCRGNYSRGFKGILKVKVVPFPICETSVNFPPCARIMFADIKRPNPKPPPVLPTSTWKNLVKSLF